MCAGNLWWHWKQRLGHDIHARQMHKEPYCGLQSFAPNVFGLIQNQEWQPLDLGSLVSFLCMYNSSQAYSSHLGGFKIKNVDTVVPSCHFVFKTLRCTAFLDDNAIGFLTKTDQPRDQLWPSWPLVHKSDFWLVHNFVPFSDLQQKRVFWQGALCTLDTLATPSCSISYILYTMCLLWHCLHATRKVVYGPWNLATSATIGSGQQAPDIILPAWCSNWSKSAVHYSVSPHCWPKWATVRCPIFAWLCV